MKITVQYESLNEFLKVIKHIPVGVLPAPDKCCGGCSGADTEAEETLLNEMNDDNVKGEAEPPLTTEMVTEVVHAAIEASKPPSEGTERDITGLVWDGRIHAGNQSKTKSGEWKRRRGVDGEVYDWVRGQLIDKYGLDDPNPVTTSEMPIADADVAPNPAITSEMPFADADVAPPPPPPPATAPAPPAVTVSTPNVPTVTQGAPAPAQPPTPDMARLMTSATQRGLGIDTLNTFAIKYGVEGGIGLAIRYPENFAKILAEVEACPITQS